MTDLGQCKKIYKKKNKDREASDQKERPVWNLHADTTGGFFYSALFLLHPSCWPAGTDGEQLTCLFLISLMVADKAQLCVLCYSVNDTPIQTGSPARRHCFYSACFTV